MKKYLNGFLFVFTVLFFSIYMVLKVHIPYFTSTAEKIKNSSEQCRVAKDTGSISDELTRKKSDIARIDSLLQLQILRESEVKTGIIEALYQFADSSRLRASKVEVGEKLTLNNRQETSVSINGTGSFSSIGKFIESIENYPKSTRVRQLVLKGTGKKDIESQVDFILME
jgi:Tfp pilus assembly protein PilO